MLDSEWYSYQNGIESTGNEATEIENQRKLHSQGVSCLVVHK